MKTYWLKLLWKVIVLSSLNFTLQLTWMSEHIVGTHGHNDTEKSRTKLPMYTHNTTFNQSTDNTWNLFSATQHNGPTSIIWSNTKTVSMAHTDYTEIVRSPLKQWKPSDTWVSLCKLLVKCSTQITGSAVRAMLEITNLNDASVQNTIGLHNLKTVLIMIWYMASNWLGHTWPSGNCRGKREDSLLQNRSQAAQSRHKTSLPKL
jgi:hypothetical protein